MYLAPSRVGDKVPIPSYISLGVYTIWYNVGDAEMYLSSSGVDEGHFTGSGSEIVTPLQNFRKLANTQS